MQGFTVSDFLGPLAGLVISLWFCSHLLKENKETSKNMKESMDKMLDVATAEAKECRAQYAELVREVIELKRHVYKP